MGTCGYIKKIGNGAQNVEWGVHRNRVTKIAVIPKVGNGTSTICATWYVQREKYMYNVMHTMLQNGLECLHM